MPKAIWNHIADWVALPATHTKASHPATGKGSWLTSCSTAPTRTSGLGFVSLLSWCCHSPIRTDPACAMQHPP